MQLVNVDLKKTLILAGYVQAMNEGNYDEMRFFENEAHALGISNNELEAIFKQYGKHK